MTRRRSEIDTDPLAEGPETLPPARPPATSATGGETAPDAPASLNPALDDIVVDLGGVYAPVSEPPANLVIHGTPGNDFTMAGDGNDLIYGHGGDDFIIGGAGNDRIAGGDGNDMIFGGEGHDKLSGEAGDDLLRGNAGDDKLFGGAGNDIVEGSEGRDLLEGGAGSDYLGGGAGDDVLRGGDDADIVDGGAGSDRIEGGKGVDTLSGGEGRDFFMSRPDEVVWNGHSHQWDVVTDFNPYGSTDRDCIDLRLILDQTTFTGTTAQQAYDQGYLSLSQYQRIDENGNITHGTIIVVDKNGSESQYHGEGVANVFLLEGVQTHELSFTTFAGHFLV
jgi:Ca2+-binding RTX toxin-like protein